MNSHPINNFDFCGQTRGDGLLDQDLTVFHTADTISIEFGDTSTTAVSTKFFSYISIAASFICII